MSLWKFGVPETALRDMIRIDSMEEYMLGDDQCCLDYPRRFPTVEFQLLETAGLIHIADSIRQQKGFGTVLGRDGETDAGYNFYIGLNGFSSTKLDSSIMFVVVNSGYSDNEQCYEIELCEGEQEIIYSILDEQCRAYYGKSCAELLEEARQAMEADES